MKKKSENKEYINNNKEKARRCDRKKRKSKQISDVILQYICDICDRDAKNYSERGKGPKCFKYTVWTYCESLSRYRKDECSKC